MCFTFYHWEFATELLVNILSYLMCGHFNKQVRVSLIKYQRNHIQKEMLV